MSNTMSIMQCISLHPDTEELTPSDPVRKVSAKGSDSANGCSKIRTAHARTKSEAADQAAISAVQDSEIARSVARELSPNFHQPGPDYIKQQGMEPVEIKEVPIENKEKNHKDSPHFYRKGTTPPHSPVVSPSGSPPPSPHAGKKKGPQLANSSSHRSSKEEKPSRKPSKEEKPSRKISKDERPSKKSSKEERPSVAEAPRAAPAVVVVAPPRQEQAPPKPPKSPEPQAPGPAPPAHGQAPAIPVNGQLHTQYHSYYVKAPVRALPPPEREEDLEEEPTELALARMPPAPRSYSSPTPKPPSLGGTKSDSKLRKQDSIKPKSLADTKKASMEIADALTEETGPNSILVAMVMLLNIGLAIVFVHFLT
ncbi:unnamed protein product [Merluccius merluccius]